MKLLQVALFFTLVMLVAHVAAAKNIVGEDTCKTHSDCPTTYSCLTQFDGQRICQRIRFRREGGLDKIWTYGQK